MGLAILSKENDVASALDYSEKAEKDIFRVSENLIYTY
jgi:hypothetical protein